MATAQSIRDLVRAIDRYLARIDDPQAAAGASEIRRRSRLALDARHEITVKPSPAPAVLAAWLDPALAAVGDLGEPNLAAAIRAAAPLLDWITYDAYDREKIGEDFMRGHAFCTLVGEGGPLPADDFCLGLFLIAPQVLYRDHHHPAPELYAPLTGPHGWRFEPGTAFDRRAAHRPVWNEPNQPHATLTGDLPFLCIFGWTRDVGLPAKTIPSDDWTEIDLEARARKAAGRF